MSRLAAIAAVLAIGCGSSAGRPPPGGGGTAVETTELCVDLGGVELRPLDPFGVDQTMPDIDVLRTPALAPLVDAADAAYSAPVPLPPDQYLIAAVDRCGRPNCPARLLRLDSAGAVAASGELAGGASASGDGHHITLSVYDTNGDGTRDVWLTYVVEGEVPKFHIAVFSLPDLAPRLETVIGEVDIDPLTPSCTPSGLSTTDANCDGAPDLVLDRICGVDLCVQRQPPLECLFRDVQTERSVFLWSRAAARYLDPRDQRTSMDAPLGADATPGANAVAMCETARRIDALEPTCDLIDASRLAGPCERWAEAHAINGRGNPTIAAALECVAGATDCAGVARCMAGSDVAPRELTPEELARAELSTGIEACDVPYNKYVRCIARTAPEDAVGQLLDSLAQSADAWTEAASTAEGRANLEAMCPTAAVQWEQAAIEMGCEW